MRLFKQARTDRWAFQNSEIHITWWTGAVYEAPPLEWQTVGRRTILEGRSLVPTLACLEEELTSREDTG